MRKYFLLCILVCNLAFSATCQRDFYKGKGFSEADTLRGALRAERTCYDVTFYDLNLVIDTVNQSISGYNEVFFKALNEFSSLQIDLFKNMEIDNISYQNKTLTYNRKENAVFIDFPKVAKGTKSSFKVAYHGTPIKAQNPPWDGGFSWRSDLKGRLWLGVSCEGIGASLWWPNKDHLSDEPDSMAVHVAVPKGLSCVSNGRLRSQSDLKIGKGDYSVFNWFVSYPINNYNVTLNIGEYAHFSDVYVAKDGQKLDLNYYVLPENLEKAKVQFKQVDGMLAAYEHYFGKYPFWRDGYAMVETSYLGMEHQSAIAYGNKYQRGYLGGMIPADMNWDYIIIHESGHEYWGNAISCQDHGEMWIHEGFTTYLESLYVEYTMSKKDAVRYLQTQRGQIARDQPVIGPRDVNYESANDIYYKGTWILHTLRNSINDDKVWFDLLKSFYEKNIYKTINSVDFEDYVSKVTKKNYKPFFEQYLRYVNFPKFVYKLEQDGNDLKIAYRWDAESSGFDMPIKVGRKDDYHVLKPSSKWQKVTVKNLKIGDFRVAKELFLVDVVKE
jgi:aminopeptidase N